MSDVVMIVGCGYLGRRVARRLIEDGTRVLGTTRSTEHARELSRLDIEPIRLDLANLDHPPDLPAVDRVLLCVGYDRRSGASRREIGVTGLVRVLGSLPPRSLQRVVYTGSISVYGQTAGEWVDETSTTEPTGEPGRIQGEAEVALRRIRPDIEVLGLGGIYGPSRIIHRDALMRGEPLLGDPARWLNLIHVDDAARAVCTALKMERSSAGGIVNVCDDRPVTRAEYADQAARALECAAPVWEGSEPAGEPNRRVRNARLKESLLDNLEYPSIEQGLPHAVRGGG